jgi:hypothetical protein
MPQINEDNLAMIEVLETLAEELRTSKASALPGSTYEVQPDYVTATDLGYLALSGGPRTCTLTLKFTRGY